MLYNTNQYYVIILLQLQTKTTLIQGLKINFVTQKQDGNRQMSHKQEGNAQMSHKNLW